MFNLIVIICILFMSNIYFFYKYEVCNTKLKKCKTNLNLTFVNWECTLQMWHQINEAQAAKQNANIHAFYEESLRNVCVQDKIKRMAESI